MAGKRTRRRFTAEFKTQAVKRVLEGGKPLAEAAIELGVNSTPRAFADQAQHAREVA